MNSPPPGAHPPPLPQGTPAPALPPPKKSRTGCVIALVVVALCGVVFLGIMAAIALPAYNDYLARSKVSAASVQAFALKIGVASFQAEHGRCPAAGDEGFDSASSPLVGATGELSIGQTAAGNCSIELRLRDDSTVIDGKSLRFEYDADVGTWHCTSDLEARYLPQDCRG